MATLRIAVLKADVPMPAVVEKFGDYGPIFRRVLQAGARHIGFPERDLNITDFDVVENPKYPKLEDVDAILISGSKYNSFDDTPWVLELVDFTTKVLSQDRVRVIGVCFGHQIIGRALGAPVSRSDAGWELGVCGIDLEPAAQKWFGQSKLRIQQFHRDVVHGCPPGVECWASSPRCQNQAMYAPKRFISVQGHPEFQGSFVRTMLEARHKMGIIDKSDFEDAIRRVDDEQDGALIGGVFLKFLLEEW